MSLGSLLAITPGTVDAAAQRPDLITVMVDDLGYLADERVLERLPNIRETFVDGGLRLKQMYGQTPLCSPGRAMFLTGQNSLHNGVVKNDASLLKEQRTIAWALERAGYHTMLVGKYMNGWDPADVPVGWTQASIFNGNDDRIQQEAVAWLEDAPLHKPVFAWLSTYAPHRCKAGAHPDYDCFAPLVPERFRGAPECGDIAPFDPPTYRTWSVARPPPRNMPDWPQGWRLTTICESLLAVDEMVGAVRKAQESRDRPAYFLFLSDNGVAWGQKGYPGKRVPLSTRLPMYVSGPGIRPGSRSSRLLSLIDVAPTLKQLGRAKMPSVDGRSFVPLLEGRPFDGRRAVLERSWDRDVRWEAIRKSKWRYIRWADGKKELYMLTTDPWEQRNLAWRRAAMARRLDKELDELIARSRS